MEGRGTYKWKNGRIYKGNFKKNLIHGEGMILEDNNVIMKGVWTTDKSQCKEIFNSCLLQKKDMFEFFGGCVNCKFEGLGKFKGVDI